MYDDHLISGTFGYSDMTFGDRIAASLALTRAYGLSIFFTLLAVWFVIILLALVSAFVFGGALTLMGNFDISSFSRLPAGAIFGFIVFYLALGLLSFYFIIGICSLVLKYVDGLQPRGGVINQVLEPWRHFFPILLCLIVWLLLLIVFQIILAVLSMIPILGILLSLAGTLIIHMVMFCALMFLSDKLRPPITEAIMTPIKLVKDNFLKWFVALLVSIAVSLPGLLIIFVPAAIAPYSNIAILLGGLLAMAYFSVASIFIFIFCAVTYRQTYGSDQDFVVDQVF